MLVDPELTSIEIIGIAIRAENDAFDLYQGLAMRVRNPLVKEQFEALAREEKSHERWLREYYGKATGSAEPPAVPDVRIKMFGPTPREDMPLVEILAIGIEKEKLSEQVYAEAERRSTDASGRRMLAELVEFERSHARKLQAMREKVRRDPAWLEDSSGRDVNLEGP